MLTTLKNTIQPYLEKNRAYSMKACAVVGCHALLFLSMPRLFALALARTTHQTEVLVAYAIVHVALLLLGGLLLAHCLAEGNPALSPLGRYIKPKSR